MFGKKNKETEKTLKGKNINEEGKINKKVMVLRKKINILDIKSESLDLFEKEKEEKDGSGVATEKHSTGARNKNKTKSKREIYC
jgi:hypothetical protein